MLVITTACAACNKLFFRYKVLWAVTKVWCAAFTGMCVEYLSFYSFAQMTCVLTAGLVIPYFVITHLLHVLTLL
jgi:hypothetical protein